MPASRSLHPIQQLVRRHRKQILLLAKRHGATELRVFGSVARGDEGPGSDLDLLAKFESTASVFARLDLAEELSKLLGVRVEVVKEEALHPVIREAVFREAVAV